MKSIENAKKKPVAVMALNLWGDPKSPFNKREYAPGQHGQRRKKMTDYGEQLYAKQKMKTYYGNVSENNSANIMLKLSVEPVTPLKKLGRLVESRLDNLVYKAKFASTVFASRQFVKPRPCYRKRQKVNIPSYMVKVGDVIVKFVKKSKTAPGLLLPLLKTPTVNRRVIWKLMVKTDRKITFIPKLEDVAYGCVMEPNLVIEYYSR